MKNKSLTLVITSLPLLLTNPTFAGTAGSAQYNRNGLSTAASIGMVGGESREYVYDTNGRKLSQLNWKIKSAPIIQGEVNYDVWSWLSANIRGWTTISKTNTVMDDYDWLNPNQSQWTDWSHHENTTLNYANDLDLSLRGWFLQNSNFKLGALVGYERNAFEFKSVGGCYRYQSGALVGCFENVPGIGYQQTFETPYVGLTGKYRINRFELGATVKYSSWVSAEDTDHHYMRNLTFREDGQNSKYGSIMLDAAYLLNERAKIFAQAAYNRYSKANADTEITDDSTGETAFIPDSAGLDNKNYTVNIGVSYRFNT